MSKLIDLTGQRFGRLTVISRAGNSKNGRAKWFCQCDCGNTVEVLGKSLRSQESASCGCRKIECLNRITHGGRKERLYRVWAGMKERCNYPLHPGYKNYGGRGIKVCKEWNDYSVFREWAMTHGYDPDAPRGQCTLDRIDVNGPYAPWNCQWVDMKTQAQNRQKKE